MNRLLLYNLVAIAKSRSRKPLSSVASSPCRGSALSEINATRVRNGSVNETTPVPGPPPSLVGGSIRSTRASDTANAPSSPKAAAAMQASTRGAPARSWRTPSNRTVSHATPMLTQSADPLAAMLTASWMSAILFLAAVTNWDGGNSGSDARPPGMAPTATGYLLGGCVKNGEGRLQPVKAFTGSVIGNGN